MTVYILFSKTGMFYPIELADDVSAIASARCNRGTVRVDTLDGRIVWNNNEESRA